MKPQNLKTSKTPSRPKTQDVYRILRVSTAVILGAGEIGGALARQLAAIDLVNRIVIVDDLANVAAGKALDVAQSAPVDRYHTVMTGTADVAAVVGAVVVIVADRRGQPGHRVEGRSRASRLIKRVAGLNQRAPIVCAGAAQASLVERGVNELGISRMRLFGSAPEALRSAIIAIVALEADAAPPDISLSVLGRPPQQIIVPWDEASIAGRTATEVLERGAAGAARRAHRAIVAAGTVRARRRRGAHGPHGADAHAARARGARRGQSR